MHPTQKKSPAARPNVRSASIRKLGKDGNSLTPTEQRKKDTLMKQFSKFGRKGYNVSSGSSEEYRANYDLIDWGKK